MITLGKISSFLYGVLPSWLTATEAWMTLGAVAAEFDTEFDNAVSGMRKRFPGRDTDSADALPFLGSDRKIIRGFGETDANYATRLKGWLTTHKPRGGPYALVEQVAEFYRYGMAGERLIINLHTKNTNFYRWDSDAPGVVQSTAPWPYDTEDNRWARWRLHVHLHAAPISPTEEQALEVPIAWNARHCFGTVFIHVNGAVLWDEPGVVWDDPDVLWGAAGDFSEFETNPLPPPGFSAGFSNGFNAATAPPAGAGFDMGFSDGFG